MQKEDIDKTLIAVNDGFQVFEDVMEAKESGDKITLMEGGVLFVKHSGKAMRFISSLPEIGKEIADVDDVESSELFDAVIVNLGEGNDEIREGLKETLAGAAKMNQGIQKILAEKKRLKELGE